MDVLWFFYFIYYKKRNVTLDRRLATTALSTHLNQRWPLAVTRLPAALPLEPRHGSQSSGLASVQKAGMGLLSAIDWPSACRSAPPNGIMALLRTHRTWPQCSPTTQSLQAPALPSPECPCHIPAHTHVFRRTQGQSIARGASCASFRLDKVEVIIKNAFVQYNYAFIN